MDFYKGGDLVKLKDSLNEGESPFTVDAIMFQRDGKLALVQSQKQFVKLELQFEGKDPLDDEQVRVNRLSANSTEGISLYPFGDHDIAVC